MSLVKTRKVNGFQSRVGMRIVVPTDLCRKQDNYDFDSG
jgi:hypothetical protein